MVLVGGIIVDRIGTRRATFLFGVLCVLGAAVTASTASLQIMAGGRLLFGLLSPYLLRRKEMPPGGHGLDWPVPHPPGQMAASPSP
ncbi:MAG: hypothetical protein WBS54_16295 [Acidobacteriota bacterium]